MLETDFLMGQFPSPKHYRALDLVAIFQKPPGVIGLEIKVVRVGLRT